MATSSFVGRRFHACRLLLSVTTVLAGGVAMPALAQLVTPAPIRQSVDGNGVDLFLGTVNVDGPKLTLGQEDPQGLTYYQLTRGNGWTDNTVASLILNSNVITVSLGGVSDGFYNSTSGSYLPTQGNGAKLTFNSGTNVYTYTRADGTVIHFDKNRASPAPYQAGEGRVTDITRPSGAKLTFTYTSGQYCSKSKPGSDGDICIQIATAYRIATVRSNYGYQLAFNYSTDTLDDTTELDYSVVAAWSTVSGVTASNLAAASNASKPTQTIGSAYENGAAYFVVTDALGRATKYRTGAMPVLGITLPGSGSEDVTFAFDGSGKVSGVTTPAGTTTYSFSDANGIRTTNVTDAASNRTTYTFDIASQRMKAIVDAVGNATNDPDHHKTSLDYDSVGRVIRITQPEGNYTQLTYQSSDRDNVTETRVVSKTPGTPPDIVTTATFPATCDNPVTCNKPITTTDARGAVTSYTYDPTHGGVTSVTQPAPSAGAVRWKIGRASCRERVYSGV